MGKLEVVGAFKQLQAQAQYRLSSPLIHVFDTSLPPRSILPNFYAAISFDTYCTTRPAGRRRRRGEKNNTVDVDLGGNSPRVEC